MAETIVNNNIVKLVEDNVAFKIAQQFPAYYREEGKELVDMVEQYYRFIETAPNMGVYNARKMFEYRDIGTTLAEMVIFWKNKFMSDLPALDDANIRLVIKNILDLYRRKGSESGIKLFFRMFYQEDANVIYPARYMFKPSSSTWKTGVYLQMFSNNNEFYNTDRSKQYEYIDLISRSIYGSISKAKAIVDKINFVYLNNTLTPIIYITDPKGKFTKYDDIIARIDGEDISFGKLNGSADGLTIDTTYGGTTGNKIGDVLNIISIDGNGKGGKAIVTKLIDEFTGTIDYTIKDGGFGYTIDNTKILVSNQALVLNNPNFQFVELERLRDTANNEGIVIGQNSIAVGVKMNPGDEFSLSRDISTVDRDVNITFTAYDDFTKTGDIFTISPFNDSSPGPLYAETGDPTHAKIGTLSDIQNIALITDVISNFLNVPLNSSNYNAVPPALSAMSGNTDPITIATALEDAFDLTPFDIGVIETLENINPGSDYVNDVWTLARDEVIIAFDRYEQSILIDNFSSTFAIGDRISQSVSSTNGIITGIDNDNGVLYVRPYSYYGFIGGGAVISHKGNDYTVRAVERNYSTKRYGENADIESRTLFSTGRIADAEIRNSGFGYVDGETVLLTNDAGEPQARAILSAKSQGITSGFWGLESSHLNGYVKNIADDGEDQYFDSLMKIQDSNYYQEFSYEIQSTIDESRYLKELKENMHLAGSRIFSNFVYNKKVGKGVSSIFYKNIKNDFIVGGDPIVGPGQNVGDLTVRADNFVYTVDTINIRVDNG